MRLGLLHLLLTNHFNGFSGPHVAVGNRTTFAGFDHKGLGNGRVVQKMKDSPQLVGQGKANIDATVSDSGWQRPCDREDELCVFTGRKRDPLRPANRLISYVFQLCHG